MNPQIVRSNPHHSPFLAVLGAGAVCWGILSLAGCSGNDGGTAQAQVANTAATQSDGSNANTPSSTDQPASQEPHRLTETALAPTGLTPFTAALPTENAQARTLFDTLVKQDSVGETWEQAHQELIAMGEEAVPVLARELVHQDIFRRETAAMTLALMGTPAPSAIEPLQAALQDESDFVRANVATALVLSVEHSAEAIPVLLELLKSADPQLRIMAATNLSAVGEEIAPHVEELGKSLSGETAPEVLLPIVELLGRLGPAAKNSIPELERISFEQKGNVGAAATQAISLIKQASAE